MKTLIYLLSFISAISFAQIVTTGGGETLKIISPILGSGGGDEPIEVKVNAFTLLILEQEKKCLKLQTTQLSSNLVQIHLRLTIRAINTFLAECIAKDEYPACMKTPIIREKYAELVKDARLKGYLKTTYKLTDHEVEMIIKFYDKFKN